MIVLAFIVAHLAADFLWQSDQIARNKGQKKWLFRHLLHHFIANLGVIVFLAGTTSVSWLPLIITAVSVVLAHGMIDMLNVVLSKKQWQDDLVPPFLKNWPLLLFVSHQILHLATILLFPWLFLNVHVDLLIRNLLVKLHIMQGGLYVLSPGERVLLLVVMLIVATKVGGVFLALLTGAPPNSQDLSESKMTFESDSRHDQYPLSEQKVKIEQQYVLLREPKLSRTFTIGYLERLIVLVLTFTGNYSAIAFIISAKTLVRFKLFDHREWAEYFLVGTLASVLIGMSCGYLLHLFW